MSGLAGYRAKLKIGGVVTQFVELPLVQLSESIFRVSDLAKKVWSKDYPIVIKDDNGAEVTVFSVPVKINYLEGVIEINPYDSDNLAKPLTVSGGYIPLLYVGGSKDYSLEIGGDILDSTAFHSQNNLSQGFREKTYGINDVSCSFSRFNDLSGYITALKQTKSPVFVSINPGGSKVSISGWFYIETDNLSGDIGGLEDESLNLVLCENDMKTNFSYSQLFDDHSELQFLGDDFLKANFF